MTDYIYVFTSFGGRERDQPWLTQFAPSDSLSRLPTLLLSVGGRSVQTTTLARWPLTSAWVQLTGSINRKTEDLKQ